MTKNNWYFNSSSVNTGVDEIIYKNPKSILQTSNGKCKRKNYANLEG